MLRKPTLALTADRTKKAQENHKSGDPADWFDSVWFRRRGIYAASFDFFVNWERETVCDEVWIKRISDTADILLQSKEELLRQIAACDGSEKSNSVYLFLKAQGLKEKYMLFEDVKETKWEDGTGRVVMFDISQYKKDALSALNAQQLQEKIGGLRKKQVSIGNAGLIYSTSALEGYLSKKPFFWPGDADTVLYNKANAALAVLEFKKHTARSRIPFEEQKLSNYLEKDILKYKSLGLLRDRLETKLFVLYYPIPPDIDTVIIEEIQGAPDQLTAVRRLELPVPLKGDEESQEAFAGRFIKEALNGQEGGQLCLNG